MTTEIEIKLKLSINSPSPVDENSMKNLINEGMNAMVDNAPETLITIGDESIVSISAEIISLTQDKQKQNLDDYGTDDVPWGR
jgi:phosphotransferase system IIB component